MSRGKVRVDLQRPTAAASAVAAVFKRRLPGYERRVLIRRGRVLASGQQKIFEPKK
jgi:hypothetical protein